MIVVDTSVWINHIKNRETEAVRLLRSLDQTDVLVGDIVLLEILHGVPTDDAARKLQRLFSHSDIVPMLGRRIAVESADNYRKLRKLGVTVRTSVDTVIGTFCIRGRHELLQDDRDFAPMVTHLGLRLAR